jgi:putative addiction module component (TIGR02574 family)
MTKAVAELLAEIDRLTPPERGEIASAVLQSLGPPSKMTEEEFEKILSRRIAEIRSGAVEGPTAEEVFARLRARRS